MAGEAALGYSPTGGEPTTWANALRRINEHLRQIGGFQSWETKLSSKIDLDLLYLLVIFYMVNRAVSSIALIFGQTC